MSNETSLAERVERILVAVAKRYALENTRMICIAPDRKTTFDESDACLLAVYLMRTTLCMNDEQIMAALKCDNPKHAELYFSYAPVLLRLNYRDFRDNHDCVLAQLS